MSKEDNFNLDENIEYDTVKQFASQLKYIPTGLTNDFEKSYSGEQSMDYYRGLISGLSAAYSVATNEQFIKNNQVDGTIGAMLSFVSKKFVDKIE